MLCFVMHYAMQAHREQAGIPEEASLVTGQRLLRAWSIIAVPRMTVPAPLYARRAELSILKPVWEKGAFSGSAHNARTAGP